METNESTLNQLLKNKTTGEVAVSNLRATARRIWLAHFQNRVESDKHIVCDIFLRQYTWKKISDDGNYFTFDDEVDSNIKDIPLFNFINKIACSLIIEILKKGNKFDLNRYLEKEKNNENVIVRLPLYSAKNYNSNPNKTLILNEEDIKLLFNKNYKSIYTNIERIKKFVASYEYKKTLIDARKIHILPLRPEPRSTMLYIADKLEDIATAGFIGMTLKSQYTLSNPTTYAFGLFFIGCAELSNLLHNKAYERCIQYNKICDKIETTRFKLLR